MATTQVIELLKKLSRQLTIAANKDTNTAPTLQPCEALAAVANVLLLLEEANGEGHVPRQRENNAPETRSGKPPTPTGTALQAPTAVPQQHDGATEPDEEGNGLEDSRWAPVQTKRARKAAQREAKRVEKANQSGEGCTVYSPRDQSNLRLPQPREWKGPTGANATPLGQQANPKGDSVSRHVTGGRSIQPTLPAAERLSYSRVAATPPPVSQARSPARGGAGRKPQAPAQPVRAAPTVRFVIGRKSEWNPRLQLDGLQLKQEVTARMGREVGDSVLAIRIFKGGDVRVHTKPGMEKVAREADWTKWVQSARRRVKEYEVVVKGLPNEHQTAEEAAARIAAENPQIPRLELVRADWVGPIEGRRTAPLRISVTRPETANFLMGMGFGLDFRMYFAERYQSLALRRRNPEGKWRPFQEKEEQEDSEMVDQDRLSEPTYNSSSPGRATFEEGEALSLDNAKKQKVAAKGRPIGALNKSTLTGTPAKKPQGTDPFSIAKGTPPDAQGDRIEAAGPIPDSQPEAGTQAPAGDDESNMADVDTSTISSTTTPLLC